MSEDEGGRFLRNNQQRARNHMSMPIPYLDDCDSYEEYKELIKLWQICTDIEELRRAQLLFFTN